MAKSKETANELDAVDRLFADTSQNFSVISALMAGLLSWAMLGYHGRLTRRRMERLQNAPSARTLKAKLVNLNDRQSAYFQGLASVNKEQADAAFRYTALINFTAPITLIVILNQLFPGFLSGFFTDFLGFDEASITLAIALFILATVGPLFHAYISASVAKDIYHLALIDGARRGDRSRAEADGGEDETVEPTDL